MNPRSLQPISTDSEWSFELIRRYDQEIARLAERYALDIYPNQIEIISAEQMMDAYASVGMPIGYHHWSYGKQFLATEKGYKRGQMGLAYEIVINSDPCIAYLMEENTLCMQALVIAHACYGHNSFFKGNYLFRSWTDASSIIDYLVFAKQYISQCEERHGIDAVEELLDSCHALMNYGVDRYKRPYPISAEEERRRQSEREEHLQRQINDLWRTIPKASGRHNEEQAQRWPAEPQENILYFLEKHAPLLEPWQREVIRIVRKLAQYFYPQRQTQVMNEGWATFWHYTLINDLYDEGLVSDGFMLEFLQYHSGVVLQPAFDSPWYSGINPYALGFAMYRDIRRICEQPNEEDRRWFPEIAGSDWLSTLKFAMQNFKDESFILQYLSPKVMRDLRLFSVLDDDQQDSLQVSAIHDDSGYRHLRETLAAQYNLGNREPNVQIWSVDRRGDRSLTLRHSRHDRRPLGESSQAVLKHLHRLWGFDIHLESHQGEQLIETLHMPPRAEPQESQSSMAL
ncbi:SpoVR family protein [Pseudomonas fluvialis]|uniref:SpoVR family protein n=1 Tax=Pseudomonas fluvialis TaxID=1793966 RepID=A0ABQ2API4_9PSED|nr:SpoVR family protein [Pseudomonas fluvialis]OXM41956.1 SpoVR family protein [Pseudomonas fluvialis]GGH93434.1 SpoVR family protein [Pseudomonas fluvialis]